MQVTATEFKAKVGKYLDIVENEEVIISRNGKVVAKLVAIKQEGTPNTDFLYGLLEDSKDKDATAKSIKTERINKKYGNTDR